jgi:hypothetical protein
LDPFAVETNVAGTLTALAGGGTPDPHAAETSVAGTLTVAAGGTILPATATETLPAPPHLRVAFISAGNAWIAEPPSAAVQLTTVGNVDGIYLSDDGALLVYTRHASDSEPAELRAVNTDGSSDRSIIASSQINSLYPPGDYLFTDIAGLTFIPGTHRLLMNTRQIFMGPGLMKSDDLYVVDADAATIATIFTAGNGGDATPSPDGARMALARSTNVSVCAIDGSGMHANVITFTPVLTYSEYAYYPTPVWAADSTRFGVIIPSPEQLSPGPTGSIWTVDAASGVASLVSTLPGKFLFPTAILSPDLAHLGYAVPTAGDTSDLYVANLDGSSALHLSTDINTAVESFSPDGQHFAYYVGEPGSVFIGSLGGGTLPLAGNVIRLVWIDNNQFVFASGTISSWTLNLGNIDGTSSIIATPSGSTLAFVGDI